LYSTLLSDKEIRDAFFKIDYSKFNYDENTFHYSEVEKIIGRLLTYLDLICYLYHQRMISDTEMVCFKYFLQRVGGNPEIKKYRDYLEKWFKENQIDSSFYNLNKYFDRL
jgi:hypothetical protein